MDFLCDVFDNRADLTGNRPIYLDYCHRVIHGSHFVILVLIRNLYKRYSIDMFPDCISKGSFHQAH